MRFLTVLVVFCLVSVNSQLRANNKYPVLKAEKEIAIHKKLVGIVNSVIQNGPTPSEPHKKELKNMALLCQELVELNKKTYRTEYSDYLIGYKYGEYEYYYSIKNVDSIFDFSNNYFFMRIKNIEDSDLVSEIILDFDWKANLVEYSYAYDDLSLKALYNDNGFIEQFSKKINNNYVGLRYETYNSSIDSDIDDFEQEQNYDVSYLMVGDYSNSDRIEFTEYKLLGHDTLEITKGNFNNSGKSQKIGDWVTSYSNGQIKKTHSFKANSYTSKLDGDEFYYYDNGDKALISHYSFGERNGVWKAFYKNGNQKYNKEYFNGSLIGMYFDNHENGKTKVKGQFDEVGNKYGKWKWFDEDGNIKKIETYNLDELNGVSKVYFNNRLTDSMYYKNGHLEGQRLMYFHSYNSEKELKGKMTYSDGKLEGPVMYYYKYGYLKDSAFYQNGEILGERKQFYENGVLKARLNYPKNYTYLSGKSDGPVVYYYNDGSVKDTAFYKKGEIQGYHTTFYENNKPEIIRLYDDGYLLEVKQFYEKGNLKKWFTNYPQYDYSDYNDNNIKNKEIFEYFENGNIKKHLLNDEERSVLDTTFFEDGKIKEIYALNKYGEKHGKQYFSFEDGAIWQSNYNDSYKDGIQVYAKGNKIDSTFVNDKNKTSHLKIYQNNELIEEKKYRHDILESYTNKNWLEWIQREGLKKVTYHLKTTQAELDEEDQIYIEDYIIGEKVTYSFFGRKKETQIIYEQGDYDNSSKIKYYRNGKIKSIYKYDYDSEPIILIDFNKKGLIKSYLNENDERAEFYEYYVNGNLYKRETYGVDGGQGVIEQIYFPNGQLNMESFVYYIDFQIYKGKLETYNDEETESMVTYYNEKGVKLSEEEITPFEYKTIKTFYENGKVKTEKYYEFLEDYNGFEDFKLVHYTDYYESGFMKTSNYWNEYGSSTRSEHYNDDAVINKRGKVIKTNTIK